MFGFKIISKKKYEELENKISRYQTTINIMEDSARRDAEYAQHLNKTNQEMIEFVNGLVENCGRQINEKERFLPYYRVEKDVPLYPNTYLSECRMMKETRIKLPAIEIVNMSLRR